MPLHVGSLFYGNGKDQAANNVAVRFVDLPARSPAAKPRQIGGQNRSTFQWFAGQLAPYGMEPRSIPRWPNMVRSDGSH